MPGMTRTFAITLVTAAVAGLCGAVVAIAADGGDAPAQPTPLTQNAALPDSALTPAQIYKRDAPGVVVITDTSTEQVPSTPFAPQSTQKVKSPGAPGSASGSAAAPATPPPSSAPTLRATSRWSG